MSADPVSRETRGPIPGSGVRLAHAAPALQIIRPGPGPLPHPLPIPHPPTPPQVTTLPGQCSGPTQADRLANNQQLSAGAHLVSPNGKARLDMQGDGNLVLYRTSDSHALWSTRTNGTAAKRAVLQSDGNFVVCSDQAVVWATGTASPGDTLILQDDGNLVIQSKTGTAIWASHTTDQVPLQAATGDVSVGAGEHMSSTATLGADGIIRGSTHTWCTKELAGFHGSVVAILLDAQGLAIWPENPQVTKHQYGVDGTWSSWFGGPHDRTDSWQNTVPASIMASGRAASLMLHEFLDPKNMLLTDLPILAKTASEIIALISAIT